jgi:glucose/arabinose dehydrogenase
VAVKESAHFAKETWGPRPDPPDRRPGAAKLASFAPRPGRGREGRLIRVKSWRLVGAILLGWLLGPFAHTAAAIASTVPPDFEDTLVTKVGGPTALTFTPDRRLLITSHFGTLRIYKNGAQLPNPALDLTNRICSDKERGLLGVAVDPGFATNRYIYLYYTFKKFGNCDYSSANGPVNRVSRFILGDNDVVSPSSETVLVDNIPNPDGIHNAGDLNFGKDGNLYIEVGDGGTTTPRATCTRCSERCCG